MTSLTLRLGLVQRLRDALLAQDGLLQLEADGVVGLGEEREERVDAARLGGLRGDRALRRPSPAPPSRLRALEDGLQRRGAGGQLEAL